MNIKYNLFLDSYPAASYVIRDNNALNSPLFRKLKSNEIIAYCTENKMTNFSLAVAAYNYHKYQILTGDICLHKNMMVDYFVSNKSNYTARDVLKDPDYNGSMSLFDKRVLKIKGITQIIDYIFEHGLFNIIVEFSVFNTPIGTKNEKVVIWELRTDY